jgi:Flp pilus assembly protein TadG
VRKRPLVQGLARAARGTAAIATAVIAMALVAAAIAVVGRAGTANNAR